MSQNTFTIGIIYVILGTIGINLSYYTPLYTTISITVLFLGVGLLMSYAISEKEEQ